MTTTRALVPIKATGKMSIAIDLSPKWLNAQEVFGNIVTASPNRGKVSREQFRELCVALCRNSSHAPNGTCAAICMDQLGDVPGKLHGCNHAIDLHGKKVAALTHTLGLEIEEVR